MERFIWKGPVIPLIAQQTNHGNITQVPWKRCTTENMELDLNAARGSPASNNLKGWIKTKQQIQAMVRPRMFAENCIANNAARKILQR